MLVYNFLKFFTGLTYFCYESLSNSW